MQALVRPYQELLGEHRLVRTAEIIQERAMPIGLLAILLAGVAVLKIYIALERGREKSRFSSFSRLWWCMCSSC